MSQDLKLTLYIGNRNYSSWSLRPWLAMTAKGIPFDEHFSQLDMPGGNLHFLEFSPTKRVPVLKIERAGEAPVTICESLAILETVADLFPEAQLWPGDLIARALARSYAAEMHAGFSGIRSACPMNLRRPVRALDLDPFTAAAVVKDVQRIEQIWSSCLEASGGPFLFGSFGAVDAMFAPVINRFETYALSQSESFEAYRDAMKALPAWKAWEEEAIKEPWVIEEDEA